MILFSQLFESKYNEIESYARFISSISKKNLEYKTAISNAYIKALKHEPKTIDEAKGIIFHYIKCELIWTRTATEKEKITAVEFLTQIEDFEPEIEQIDLFDIVNSEVKNFDFIDRIFFQKFIEYKLSGQNIRDLAKFYSIDYLYCRRKVNKLKKQIRCKI